jgi:hypothetical protein
MISHGRHSTQFPESHRFAMRDKANGKAEDEAQEQKS